MSCITSSYVGQWLSKGKAAHEPNPLLEMVLGMSGMPDEGACMYVIDLDHAAKHGIAKDDFFDMHAVVGLEREDEISLWVGGVMVFEFSNTRGDDWVQCNVPWREMLEDLRLL